MSSEVENGTKIQLMESNIIDTGGCNPASLISKRAGSPLINKELGRPPDKKTKVNGTANIDCVSPNTNGKSKSDPTKKKKRLENSATDKTELNHNSHDHLIKKSQQSQHVQSVPKAPKKRLSDLMYIEHYDNGGGYILHAYQDELVHLDKLELDAFVVRFYKTLFGERSKKGIPYPFSNYSVGIVHGAAEKVPELVNYMSQHYGHLTVKTNTLDVKNDVQSLTMHEYADNVYAAYSSGLYRYGPMHAVSIVGTKGEETGTYCTSVVRMMEKNAFLRPVLPWGSLSNLEGMEPSKSNDGPILWTRPGEQAVPAKSTPMKKKRSSLSGTGSMVANMPVFGRGGIPRQTVVPDRTPCHADHADDGLLRHTTAAAAVLKAVHPPSGRSPHAGRRIVKDAILFDPRFYSQLINRLQLDILEPPASQCGNFWADDAELNQLRLEGFRYVRVFLRDDDIYFIPRNVVHQFKTVAAVTSIAWHVRLKSYYKETATPDKSKTENIAPTPDKPSTKDSVAVPTESDVGNMTLSGNNDNCQTKDLVGIVEDAKTVEEPIQSTTPSPSDDKCKTEPSNPADNTILPVSLSVEEDVVIPTIKAPSFETDIKDSPDVTCSQNNTHSSLSEKTDPSSESTL